MRYNRGGHVSRCCCEKLARKRIGYDLPRWGAPHAVSRRGRHGPVVALTNEHAGSDGDIFSHSFKLMDIGPLVGTRTWGGVIGIWPRHALVDGTADDAARVLVLVQRRRLGRRELRHRSGHRGRQRAAGCRRRRDRQLEIALATVVELIERGTMPKPAFDKRPNLKRGPLPPRL